MIVYAIKMKNGEYILRETFRKKEDCKKFMSNYFLGNLEIVKVEIKEVEEV